MNTWHIVTSEYPPDVGGVSDYTCQVAAALARAGDDVHVWCPGPAPRIDVAGVHAHPELGRIGPADLRRLSGLLDAFPAPRRLLVQWVPHGFGYHSMNVWFCAWLVGRARAGDEIELMVHEPYLEFGRGPLRHAAIACVHRLMTLLLLRAAGRVWMSIPAWEARLRPYALGRPVAMTWLPVPACVPSPASHAFDDVRRRYAGDDDVLIGHFGSFGSAVSTLLDARLPAIMDGAVRPSLLLLGAGGDAYRASLLERHPEWAGRVHAAGYVPSSDLAAHLAMCDLFVQPYPDGITSRRTSAMACLAQGRPVVTTYGHLTEPFWASSGAVLLADVGDVSGFVAHTSCLVADVRERTAIGERGRTVYGERFAVDHVVAALRAA